MTEPYRAAALACPACGTGPLREYQNRLVCDRCQGMLVGDDDLLESLRDPGSAGDRLEARNAQPATATCPRCTRAMQSCTLHLGSHALDGRYLRCETDGTWLTQPQLVGELARTSRTASAGTRGLTSTASAMVDMAPKGSGSAALQGIGDAFTKNQRLPIGYRPPRVRVAFVSAFHGRELACPACASKPALAFAGDRWACPECAGAFVEDAALVAMVQDITAQPWEVPKLSGSAGDRACPVCDERMAVDKLGTVTLDRCAGHGTWFDQAELGHVLMQSAEPADAATASHGIGGWLRKLFHR
ncbi:MAG TPA: zf-TFIIB domain-containing protein [Kofleriaceae bacterium]|nr:zf-TFIIB domain-containing protein [Kofleriaceae bacterium]